MKRIQRIVPLPLILVVLATTLAPVVPVPEFRALALERQRRLAIMPAVVQVWWVWEEGSKLRGVGMGSGTIVAPDGLILTNYHVAFPDEPLVKYLGVAMTTRSDEPPKPTFLAEVVAADEYLDLAVLRINRNLDLSPVRAETLNLPYAEVGDSDLLDVGDEVNIFGYPAIGGETITFTRGVISGFSLDAAIQGRAWIKTDTTISGGNSGGTAVDENGLLVGVPTRAGAGTDDPMVDCRPVTDTNGDGRVDENDTCVPIGGFINAMRPVKLARPLLESARLGVSPPQPTPPPPGPAATGQPRFSNLFFAPDINEVNQATSVITSLPSGARSLYLFFEYENMSPDRTWEMKVSIDGQEAPDWALPAGPWGGGEQGLWWVGWSDAPFVDGNWELRFSVDGRELAKIGIKVGGAARRDPAVSNVVFAQDASAQGTPVSPGVVFPAGSQRIYAFFDYQNMSNGTPWSFVWYMDGEEDARSEESWDGGAAGSSYLWLSNDRGLPAGDWRLDVYVGNRLAARQSFWLTGTAQTSTAFAPIVFGEGQDQRGRPVRPATSFASGLAELHAFSDYQGMQDGLNTVVNWYIDGEKVIESPFQWDGGAEGIWHDYLYSTQGPLPDGEFGVELIVEGNVVQSGSTRVGAGGQPAPTPSPQPQDGVQVQGTITDLDTGRPIQGAGYLVLNPGITTQTFQWTDAELYDSAVADRNGFFRGARMLVRAECYTMIFGAEGYWAYGEDDVCITDQTPEVVDLTVQLEKK